MWKLHSNPFIYNNRPLIMAHRGDSSNIPENTMQAFQEAYNLQVDCLETDIHMTKDNEFVLFHDNSVDRTTNGSGNISDFTLAELKELDAGYRFEKKESGTFPYRGKGLQILAIEEIIPHFPDVRFNLDMKSKHPKTPKILAEKLKRMGVEDRVIVGSFHQKQVHRFRQYSTISTSAGTIETINFKWKFRKWKRLLKRGSFASEFPKTMQEITRNQKIVFHHSLPYFALQVPEVYSKIRIVTPEFINYAHFMGIAVHVWTVNEPKDMKRLFTWGVDGLFTDKPSLLIEMWNEIKNQN